MKKYPIYVKFIWNENRYAIWKIVNKERALCILADDAHYLSIHGIERDHSESILLGNPDINGIDLKKEIINNTDDLFLEMI